MSRQACELYSNSWQYPSGGYTWAVRHMVETGGTQWLLLSVIWTLIHEELQPDKRSDSHQSMRHRPVAWLCTAVLLDQTEKRDSVFSGWLKNTMLRTLWLYRCGRHHDGFSRENSRCQHHGASPTRETLVHIVRLCQLVLRRRTTGK